MARKASALLRLFDNVVTAIDRLHRAIMVGFAVALAAMLAVRAGAKPFWHDELYTVLASRFPIPTLWRASLDGFDLAPPLNTILTRAVHAVWGIGPVATRLPAIVGFWSACLILFVIVRRRSSVLAALSAALIPIFSGAFWYAYEARGYGLAIAWFAVALYGWSEAARGRRRFWNLSLMAVALAAGMWTHYYTVLAVLPIVMGELVSQIEHRRFDAAPWIAVAAACAAATPLWPLVHAAMPQAPNFWTRLEPPGLANAYGSVLGSLQGSRFLAGGAIVAVIALAATLQRLRGVTAVEPGDARQLPRHEVAAGLAALMIPAIGVLIGTVADAAFAPRYVLFAIVGFAITIPLATWRLTPGHRLADVVLCLTLILPFVKEAGRTLQADRWVLANPVADRGVLARQLTGTEPLVLSCGIDYLQLWYYAPPEAQNRALYVADPEAELRQTHTDTVDRGYLALARWTSVPVTDYSSFIADHQTFHLYVCGPDWLTSRLRAAGAWMREVEHEPGGQLFDVRLQGG